MRTSIKLAVAALVAVTLLGGLAAIASARRLLVSEQTFRIVWRELEFEAKESQMIRPGRIICAVTMEGSFHGGTIQKSSAESIGDITRAIVEHPCQINRAEYWIWNGTERLSEGEAALATSLPWPLLYEAFTGTLPNISAVRLRIDRRIKMTVRYNNALCEGTYGANADGEGNVLATLTAGVITRFEPVSIFLLRQSGIPLCPTLTRLIGASTTITGLNNSSRLTITLI